MKIDLEPCRWRGRETNGRYPCSSPKLVARKGVTAEICAKCYCRDHYPPLNFARRKPDPPRISLNVLSPCRHEGPVAEWGKTDACHIRHCLHPSDPDWEFCVRETKTRPGSAQVCRTCDLYDIPGRRHLLYHLLPVNGNGVWQWNLDQLKTRIELFDGRRVIAVATGMVGGGTLDTPDAVREYLGDMHCEIVEVPNDPRLREVASWPLLWRRVADLADTDDVVFYGHAKGVTRPWNPGVTVHTWTRLAYASLLDYWPIVARTLGAHPLAGSFLKVGRGFRGSRSIFHYSGSFFWGRLRDLFHGDRLAEVDQNWWGTESWPGRHFTPEQAGCVFHEGKVPHLDLYNPGYVVSKVLPLFREWSERNAHMRTKWKT